MNGIEIKKLRIAIWSLTFAIVFSVIVEVAFYGFLFIGIDEISNALADEMSEMDEMITDESDKLKDLYYEGNYKSLQELAEERIKTHPNDEYSYYYLGLMYYQNGDLNKAYNNLLKASKLDPTWSQVDDYIDIICDSIKCE